MISVNWDGFRGDVGSLVRAYSQLPRHIAKKHLVAAIRRTLRPGVPILRSLTPPTGVRRGRRKKGEGPKSTGKLRKAVTTKAKYVGRNADGFAYGVVGYRYGMESWKAIWLEFGTSRGIRARGMVQKFIQAYRGPSAAALADQLAIALERATRELESGKNPGYKG